MQKSYLLLASLALAGNSYAAETRFWQQTDQADFEKGTLTHLSLRSDGRLYLAPDFREIYDPSTPYLWALAADGKGSLYAGGGGSGNGTAKLFAVDAQGKGRTVAELEGLEIHAIAMGPDGQIYAATDPDGKVYKVSPQGKSQVFFDPHAKYIWALAFNSKGELFVATGDHGEIYRVGRDGKGSLFFKTGETHARSLTVDAQDNLIAGTEPGGLVIRVSPAGTGFVLYQTAKREVTAVAVGKSGEIYAAAVGTRSAAAPVAAVPVPPPPPPVAGPAGAAGRGPVTVSVPTFGTPPPPITGGSEVYRINKDGAPRKVWSNAQDIVYAIGFDLQNRPLLGTGNRGKVYRADSEILSTVLIDASSTQITSFAYGPNNRLYAATGNIGRVYEIGPAVAAKGVFESDVLDTGAFTYWGRLSFRGTPRNAVVMTRSGNLSRPQENWSPWAPLQIEPDNSAAPCARCLNGRIASPAARFLQYKVELAGASSAELASVEIAYLSKNIAPQLEEVEITPPNYKFPAPAGASAPSQSLTLPPLGQKKRPSGPVALDLSSSASLTYGKGMIGARWTASDENGDTLLYAVEIRGVGESSWKLLKDKLREKYYSWDSTAFPDGEYEVRVTATDSPGNGPDEALTASLMSDPFLIDNTPPQITGLTAAARGNQLEVRWKARDARSIIEKAEYSLNGGDWIPVRPETKLSDSPEESYRLTLDHGAAGQTVAVRVTDSYENQAVEKTVVR